MDTTTIAYALISGVFPALIWLWFWLKEDNLHPEPRLKIAQAFITGAVFVIIAILLEKVVADIITDQNDRYMWWASIEEMVKFLVFVIVAWRSKYMDEPIDAIIYFITVALGFAALENTLFIFTPIEAGNITKSIVTGNLRFIGATLVHVISSASIGLMIAITFYKGKFWKTIATAIGIVFAIVLHTSFNLSIINVNATDTLKVFAWVWCSVIILLIIFEEVKAIRPKKINS